MKKLIFSDEKGRVTVVHNKPEKLSTEKRRQGLMVDYVEPEVDENSSYTYTPYVKAGELVWERTPKELSNVQVRSLFKITELAILKSGDDSIATEVYNQLMDLDGVKITCPLLVDILDYMKDSRYLTEERYKEIKSK